MPKRADGNQREIVKTFRMLGYTVAHTHTVGKGFPDIVVGRNQVNYLIEIKDGSLPPSRRKLTDDEQYWHDNWLGQVAVIESIDDVQRFHVEHHERLVR
jgi:hypothetical protein